MKTFDPKGKHISAEATDDAGRYSISYGEFDPYETTSFELSLLSEDSLICGRVPVWAALQLTRMMDDINGIIEHFTQIHGD